MDNEIIAEEKIQCPKCGSTQLTSGKHGFSAGKAVGGALLTGGIGLLAGLHGSNKVEITCLKCGNKFKPGEKKKEEKVEVSGGTGSLVGVILIVLVIYFLISGC
jgi:DNA-directed RNA polymerase subunit RPC12/RpoP